MSAFLFPGQGSQIPGMGQDFYDRSPVAREIFDRAAAMSPPGLLDAIFQGTEEALADTRLVQPALVTVETAIAQHLISLGHEPTVCAGHSLGEVSALVLAGVFTLEQALPLIRTRGRCMADRVPKGGMAAVLGIDAATIEAALPDGVDMANFNGPAQTIISGTEEGLAEAEACLKQAGARRIIRLRVAGPFHSRHMAAAAEEFGRALDGEEFRPPRLRFVSSVSGEEVSDPEEVRTLLKRQIVMPVQWTNVMRRIGPVRAFEVGPGRVLQGLAKRAENAPLIEPTGTFEEVASLQAPPSEAQS